MELSEGKLRSNLSLTPGSNLTNRRCLVAMASDVDGRIKAALRKTSLG
jgi:hypothetical protein